MALSTRKLCFKLRQANEELFGEIKLELDDALQEDDEEKFTVDRLRAKFKRFKKEWRRIDNKIKCGTGLGRDDQYLNSLKDVRAQKFPRTDFFKTLIAGRK